MIFRILSLILIFLFNYATVTAQQLSAARVLHNTTERINSANALVASFTATADDNEMSKGELTMDHEKFKMITDSYSVWYNGEAMWSFYTNSDEVNLTEPTADELLEINPFDIIKQYDTHYSATIVSHKDNEYIIQLSPIAKNCAFKKATIAINQTTWFPKNINVVFDNSSTIKIDILSIKELPQKPSSNSFEFPYSQFPNVPVVDLR